MKKKIFISTGGSGGHVIPAIAFYDHFKENFDVFLVLDKRGSSFINEKKYKYKIIKSPRLDFNLLNLPIILIKLVISIFRSFFFLKKSKVDIVQAAGRALRISKGKKFGYILIPIFVSNNQDKNFKYELVDGYKLATARKKFGINHIDLLKMDCKECEFYLTDDDLKDIDRIKLEYAIIDKKYKLDDLLDILRRNGFMCSIFRHVDTSILSNRFTGTIYARKV